MGKGKRWRGRFEMRIQTGWWKKQKTRRRKTKSKRFESIQDAAWMFSIR